MNCSLDVITTTTNWIKNILKIVPKLVLARVTKAHPYLVINLIPLRLWQMKIGFEDGLINFKLLFLKLERSQNFLFSCLIYSIQWQLMKTRMSKKPWLPLDRGMLLISSCVICFVNGRILFSIDTPGIEL